MTSNANEAVFADRRSSTCRRSEYDLSRIGADRRCLQDRRNNNGQYTDSNWWLQVDYFDGHYMIKPGAKITETVFESPENLQKM